MSNLPPPPLPGPFTLEDVMDGVPGAAEGLAQQATEAKEQTSSVPPGSHYCPDCLGSGSEMNPKAMHLVPCPKCLGTACLHHRSQKKEGHCAVCEQDENCLLCKINEGEQVISHDTAKEWDESLDEPAVIKVLIPGITPTERGQDFWEAREVRERPGCYRIDGDPNAVAVGRFKASLRKFLGIT